MKKIKMSFDEIKDNKDKFLETYGLVDMFKECGYTWDELIEIGEDYNSKRDSVFFNLIQNFIVEISKFTDVHSYRYRIKETDSLIAKIIRKGKSREEKITIDNYCSEITDLLGIRILYIFKEDYWSVNKQLMDKYKPQLAENIHLKLRDGDDQKTYQSLLSAYDVVVERNEAYRSIHYTIYSDPNNIISNPKIEIQTRTIFEEGWSEINHKLVYKNNSFPEIEKVSNILSELVGSCDTVSGLMQYLYNRVKDDNGTSKMVDDLDGKVNMLDTGNDSIGDVIRKFLS
ncbi:MAG: RelA/SpoT domain-containing protein [Eubacterium sp.]|nr:RelA/SpoT domain-containing protein [Eubacterium sp.]